MQIHERKQWNGAFVNSMLNIRNTYLERKGNDTTGEEEGRKKGK